MTPAVTSHRDTSHDDSPCPRAMRVYTVSRYLVVTLRVSLRPTAYISVSPGVRGGDYFFSSTTYNPILKPAATTACASRTGASQPSFYGTLTQSVTRAASSTRSELFDYRIQQFYYPPVRVRKKLYLRPYILLFHQFKQIPTNTGIIAVGLCSLLLQMDRATRFVSRNLVNCCTTV